MNRLACVLVVVSAFVVGACKGKPTDSAAGSGSAGSGSAVVKPGSGSGSAAATKPPAGEAILLPEQKKSPPVKTTAAISAETITKLEKTDFKDFVTLVVGKPGTLENGYTTRTQPNFHIRVQITPCMNCLPMDLEKWKAQDGVLKSLFPKSLEGAEGTVFEPGVRDFYGQPMIYTYIVGQATKIDSDGNTTADFANAYTLYFNDGVNSIRVIAEYRDRPFKTVEILKAQIPRKELEQLCVAFMDYFTHNWAP